ncbi:hypothetical protein EJB05_46070, partial [Eragrostis curvula]
MLRAHQGGSLTATRCMRIHCHKAPDQALPFTPPNSIKGNFRPVSEIGEAVLLKDLDGEVPQDFPEGVYIRNGPNPLNPTKTIADSIVGSASYLYYEGHGMLHAVYFNKISLGEWKISYKNKYVDSDTFQLEREKNEVTFLPSADGQPYATLVAFVLNLLRFGKAVKDSANTNIFEHAGRVFAVSENHLPYEININNLNTLGPYNINGAWDQPFTSHPKKIQETGELVIMGTNIEKPHYVLGVISSDGEKLLHKVDLKFDEGKFIHDIGVTNKYNIIMDYPLKFGILRTFLGKPFIENDMDGKSRIGVMPCFGNAESIKWFDVENHCSYHLFNCFEDGNEVVVRGCRIVGSVIPSGRYKVDKSKWYGRAFLQPDRDSNDFDPLIDGILFSRPYEWRLNLKNGTTNEGYITSEKVAMDFPAINEKFTGIRNKYGYAQVVDSLATSKTGLFKYKMIAKLHFDEQDKENKQLILVEYHTLKEREFCSGVQFVAKENGIDEDDGWVVTYVHNEETDTSQVYIIDAKRFSEEPVAKVTLPQRVPYVKLPVSMDWCFVNEVKENGSLERKARVQPPGWKKQELMQEISTSLKSISSNLLQGFIDTAYKFSEQPSLNEGNFRPVSEISEAVLLKDLDGEVPEDFPEGVYIRNGPNPLNPTQTVADSIVGSTSYMYYEGHGMLHAVYFKKSSLREWKISYKNKYVDSDTFQLEREKNEVTFVPSADGQPYATLVAIVLNLLRFGKAVKDSANTNIFEHAGRAFAVTENHLPYEINISDLNTLGPYNINGAWDQPFTSHPKKIRGSGELVIMGTNTEKPHYVLGVISCKLSNADGERLVHKVDLKFDEGKLIHDIGVTIKYNIIMDYPLRFGILRTFLGKPFIENGMDGKSRIGVMPRFGDAASIKWFDVENHCSYHLFNCFEDGNEVVVRGCRIVGSVIPSGRYRVDKSKLYGRAFLQPDRDSNDFDPSIDGILFSRPYKWRLNLKNGTANEGYITSDKVAMDFPVINEKFTGIQNKYGYAQVVDSLATSKTGLFKYKMIAKLHFDEQDKENKQMILVEYHTLKEKEFCSGVQFVAKENEIDEDDGWVVTYVHNEETDTSQVYIIDAKRFSEEPVAKVTLPQRVPYGFHGNFFYK